MVDLSSKELRNYSLGRAICGAFAQSGDDPIGSGVRSGRPYFPSNFGSLELEVTRAKFKEWERGSPRENYVFVPAQVLSHFIHAQQRDLVVANSSAGGYLVGTENVGFIDLLFALSVTSHLGVQEIDALKANATIPKATGAPQWHWLGTETTAVNESTPSFGQAALTPKNGGSTLQISRQLVHQISPAADRFIATLLLKAAAQAKDQAVLAGTGAAGQPTGIINTAGIGTVTGASLDYSDIVEFQTDSLASIGDVTHPGFATTVAVAGALKTRMSVANTWSPIWSGGLPRGSIDGSPAVASANMPSGGLLYGDWGTVIVGIWGDGIELRINPYAGFAVGLIEACVMLSMDVAVTQPNAFSYASSVT